LNRFDASLFEDIEWSTGSVAVETLRRLAQLGWNVEKGQTVHDIDDAADLRWLPREWLTPLPERESAEDKINRILNLTTSGS